VADRARVTGRGAARRAPAAAAWARVMALAAAGAARRAGAAPAAGGGAASAAGAGEADEIHFTITGPASVTFDWRGSATVLRYWITPAEIYEARPSQVNPLPVSSPGPFHEAIAERLTAGARYHYAFGLAGPAGAASARLAAIDVRADAHSDVHADVHADVHSDVHSFLAPGGPGGSDFVVAVEGDIGASTGSPGAARVQQLVAQSHPALVLGLGDLTYADLERSTPASVDRHFNDVMVWSREAAYMPVWGNHEWESPARDDLRNYKGRFALPNAAASPGAPAAGCCGKDWYWFDYGPVRFVSYPEPYTRATWVDWAARAERVLAQAEADPRITFVVTLGHRPAFSSGHHGGEDPLRRKLDAFGRRFTKYVLNLNGHSHDYERTTPRHGVVHVTVGIGGGSLEHGPTACLWNDCTPPRWSARRAIHHGFLRLRFTPSLIEGTAICGPASAGSNDIQCAEGEPFDRFTIQPRPAAAP
jgi:hypothetical protein